MDTLTFSAGDYQALYTGRICMHVHAHVLVARAFGSSMAAITQSIPIYHPRRVV